MLNIEISKNTISDVFIVIGNSILPEYAGALIVQGTRPLNDVPASAHPNRQKHKSDKHHTSH